VNSAAQPGKPTTLDDITATIGLRAFTTEAPAGAASAAAATPTTTAAPAAGKTTTASTAAAAVP